MLNEANEKNLEQHPFSPTGRLRTRADDSGRFNKPLKTTQNFADRAITDANIRLRAIRGGGDSQSPSSGLALVPYAMRPTRTVHDQNDT